MSLGAGPPPVTQDLNVWAQNIVAYLRRTSSRLLFRPAAAPATDDGVLLWDPVGGYPVVSKGGEYRQIVLSDGNAVLARTTDLTAAAANTAYQLPLTQVLADGISVVGGDVVFGEAGLYALTFTAQISSTSSSAVTFRFWPRINGTNTPGSTMVATLHANGATNVVSRTMTFSFAAGDVLRVMWAVDSTAGHLQAHAATAYAPAAPAATLAVNRVHG